MLVSILDLDEIMDLPKKYGSVIRALAGAREEMPALFADRFLLASNHQGHLIWRTGPEQVLQKLTELRIVPGVSCAALAPQALPGPQCLGGPLWVTGSCLSHREDVCVWIGRDVGPETPGVLPGEATNDPATHLLVRYLDLKTRWDADEFQRQQFAIERSKLETFYQLTSELSELNTPDEILVTVTRRVSELMDAGTTIVYGHNPAQTRLIPLCGHKIPAEQLKSVRFEIETGDTFISQVYESGQIKRIDDVGALELGRGVAVLGDLGLRSILMVPIRLRDRRLGVMVAGQYVKNPFETSQAEVLSFAAHQIALILDNARLRSRLSKRLQDVDRELNLAKGMQALMVPQEPLAAGDVQAVGATRAAKQLGGDYFDHFIHRGCLNMIVADIMGKGVAAALLMAILRSHFRTVFQQDSRLTPANLNRFREMVYSDFKPQRAFATVLLISLDLTTHELSVLSAGHHPPLLASPSGITEIIKVSVPALGLFNQPIDEKAVQRIPLRPGEALLAYTDGVLDAVSDGGERFGPERLRDALAAAYAGQSEPVHLLQAVRAAVERFASDQPDDTTLCLLTRNHA